MNTDLSRAIADLVAPLVIHVIEALAARGVPPSPVDTEAVMHLGRQLSYARQDRDEAQAEVTRRGILIAATRPPMEPEPRIGQGRASVRELRAWLRGEMNSSTQNEDRIGNRLEAAGLLCFRSWKPTELGREMLANLPEHPTTPQKQPEEGAESP